MAIPLARTALAALALLSAALWFGAQIGAAAYEAASTVTLKEFVATWARARKAWCEATGEPLV